MSGRYGSVLDYMKDNYDLTKTPTYAYNDQKKKFEESYAKMQKASKTGVKQGDQYIQTPANKMTGYDKAIGALNPSLQKQKKEYETAQQNMFNSATGMANLDNINTYYNQLFNKTERQINDGYDKMSKATNTAYASSRDNALSSILGLGGNAVQNSSISAQFANKLATAQLENESAKQKALAEVTQNRLNIPTWLGGHATNNATFKQNEANNRLLETQTKLYEAQADQMKAATRRTSAIRSGAASNSKTPKMSVSEADVVRQYLLANNIDPKQFAKLTPQEQSMILYPEKVTNELIQDEVRSQYGTGSAA